MSKQFLDLEKDIHEIKLRQMGGEVEVIRGIMHYVRFDIGGTIVKYVYHINKKGKYFLQRQAPYPLNAGTYESEQDVIDIIRHDLAQMKNAKKSKKFDKFIEMNKNLSNMMRKFEDLYLYYNVPSVQMEKIEKTIQQLGNLIFETKDISERVYFEKDPESL
ncbi:ROK family protein [Thermotalea metallivorans]|uniref:ROK family protein n=1 Tax=Thermotalea metallivorans TaxID=520762 RepID=UPI000838F63D|nr:ROK family protein [Thermotalea metallivorans]